MPPRKQWHIAPPLPAFAADDLRRFHPILARILYNRGFQQAAEAEAFLNGEATVIDPFQMQGMPQAVSRIRRAIKNAEKIVVYGDFDADGVTSTALLTTALRTLGANVSAYIPHRVDEGYGLNDQALVALAKRGVALVITVDCGIRSLQEVETGKQAGLDLIITDHHSLGAEVPAAAAVINPKQPGCKGEPMLAGVGVAYKLAEALFKVAEGQGKQKLSLALESLLDLVAIGTVADLAPMDRLENRRLVQLGLAQIRQGTRLGLRALLEVAGVDLASVDAESIGFAIGPRINAAGRLDSAMIAYELLCTDDVGKAAEHARSLQALNARRQSITREMQAYALQLTGMAYQTEPADALIFAVSDSFAQGIVGLVAGRLTEEFYRPAIIIHQGENESHGSCRSIAEFNITHALDQCADLLLRHGGHAQAAGFAIANENLPAFQAQITEIAANGLRGLTLQPSLHIDADLNLNQIDMALYNSLRQLQPCGHSLPAPILCARRLKVLEARAVGSDNAHLKLKLSQANTTMSGIAFRLGQQAETLPPYVDVAFQLGMNNWNGSQKLELNVLDLQWPQG
jgi:single-stranded-DNA-specific exonuclease